MHHSIDSLWNHLHTPQACLDPKKTRIWYGSLVSNLRCFHLSTPPPTSIPYLSYLLLAFHLHLHILILSSHLCLHPLHIPLYLPFLLHTLLPPVLHHSMLWTILHIFLITFLLASLLLTHSILDNPYSYLLPNIPLFGLKTLTSLTLLYLLPSTTIRYNYLLPPHLPIPHLCTTTLTPFTFLPFPQHLFHYHQQNLSIFITPHHRTMVALFALNH